LKIIKWRTIKNCNRLRAIISVLLIEEQLILHNCCIFKKEDNSIYFRTPNIPSEPKKLLVVCQSKQKNLSLQKRFAKALSEFRVGRTKLNLYTEGSKWNNISSYC
jgi:hypothetical protein